MPLYIGLAAGLEVSFLGVWSDRFEVGQVHQAPWLDPVWSLVLASAALFAAAVVLSWRGAAWDRAAAMWVGVLGGLAIGVPFEPYREQQVVPWSLIVVGLATVGAGPIAFGWFVGWALKKGEQTHRS